MFAVVRHPDVQALGTIPQSALEYHRLRGWYRVSDWRDEPADFHLPEFANQVTDLDAPPEPEPAEDDADTESETDATVEDEEQEA